ncbi:hypothetical protein [Streptomyces spiramenti]|uniref:Uncharacterized protein n=1 Tax=Streptomyces spiramenti TaxID=2720606 RepID=A0ABX1AKM1_9ACTN|nr:hypothetical protein [Streptomyces spiramenti]NJP65042.1 hypothetical protein [Streptomyces spiramenti]
MRSPDAHAEWYVDGTWSATPDEALAWLRHRAERLASVLEADPAHRPGTGPAEPASPVAAVLRDWAADAAFLRVQRDALAAGAPVSANARGPDRFHGGASVEVLYSLSARPVPLRSRAQALPAVPPPGGA